MITINSINMTAMEKTIYLLETVNKIGKLFRNYDNITKDLESLCDTIYHTAPEVINKRWIDIYLYCSNNFKDGTNLKHFAALNIYNERYEEYKKKFININ